MCQITLFVQNPIIFLRRRCLYINLLCKLCTNMLIFHDFQISLMCAFLHGARRGNQCCKINEMNNVTAFFCGNDMTEYISSLTSILLSVCVCVPRYPRGSFLLLHNSSGNIVIAFVHLCTARGVVVTKVVVWTSDYNKNNWVRKYNIVCHYMVHGSGVIVFIYYIYRREYI